MLIGIVSGGLGWHVQDLIRAAHESGHRVHNYDFRDIQSKTVFPTRNIIRTMPSGSLEQIVFRMDLLHSAQRSGIRFANTPRVVEICIDKCLTDLYLQAAKLRVPRTYVCQRADQAMIGFADLGSDIVLKPIFGSEGRGMMRISDPDLAWRSFRALEQIGAVLYLQEYIRHPGWDYRAFVIRDRVVAAMKRHAVNDWRTNIAQGGRAEMVRLSPELEQLAICASQTIGCDFAGVDMMQSLDGKWYILEINGAPGWRTISEVCQIDIASLIIQSVIL